MSYTIRPAKRSEAKPLIGLYSQSGCGKTLSALFLARGFAGPTDRVVMIETEAGRGEAYADLLPGGYDVCPIRDNFAPAEYGKALTVVEKAQPAALIIDSASHEWESAGGVLAMAAANQEAGKKGQAVWTIPKMEHQRHFMLRLLSTPIPLVIVNMRAKYPMVEKVKDGRKEWTRSEELEPKQSEDILFEMFLHGWIDREHRFHGTKYTRDDLRKVIVDGERISIATGERLAAWARDIGNGGQAPTAAAAPPATTSDRTIALSTIRAALHGLKKDDQLAVCRAVFGDGLPDVAKVAELADDVLIAAATAPDLSTPSPIEAAKIRRRESAA